MGGEREEMGNVERADDDDDLDADGEADGDDMVAGRE